METWIKLDQRTVLDNGRYLRVDQHGLLLPDGRIIPDWPVVVTPDYINVLARDRDARFVMFRQTKYMAPSMRLSPPGGYLEPGEDPLSAARRELEEETGYLASRWIHLGSFVVDSNRGCGNAHLYLALDAEKHTEAASDDLETQELALLTRDELEAALEANTCAILSANLLLTLALRHLDRENL